MEVSVWHRLVFIVYMYVCNGYESTCPSVGHWNFRANSICPKIDQYTCLFDVSKGQYVENCKGPRIEVQGQKTTINNNYLNTEKCSKKRYQPIDFSTVRATSCIYQKSECVEEGQYTILHESKRSTVEDATCGCNSNKGFILMSEMNKCSCTPSVEDCSCMRRRPDLNAEIPNIYIEKCSSPIIPENRDKDQDKITKYQVGSNIKRPGFSNKAAGTVVFIIVLMCVSVFSFVLWKTTQKHYLEERLTSDTRVNILIRCIRNKERDELENKLDRSHKTGEMREDMHTMRSYDETKKRNSSHLKCDQTRFEETTNNDDKIQGKVDTTNFIDKSSKESDNDDDNDGNDNEFEDTPDQINLSNENGKTLKPDDVYNKPSKVNEESFDELIAKPYDAKPKEQNTDDKVDKTDSRQASYLEGNKTMDGIGTEINESIESIDTSTDAFQSCTNIRVIGNQDTTNNDDIIKEKEDTTNFIDKSPKESDIADDSDGNNDEFEDASDQINFSNENGKKLKSDDVSNKPSKVYEESVDKLIANPNVTKPKEQNTDDKVSKTDSRQASYLECDKTSLDGYGTEINESIESKDTSTDTFQSCTNIRVIANQETINNDDIIKGKEDTANFIDKSSKESDIDDDNYGNDDEFEDATAQIKFSNENGKKIKPDNGSNTQLIHKEQLFEKKLTDLDDGKNNDPNTDNNYEKENGDGNAGKKKTGNNLTNQNICYSSKKKNSKDNSERENTDDIGSLETDNINDSPAKENTNDSLEMNKTNDSPIIEHTDDSLKQGNTTDSLEKEKSDNSAEKENTTNRPERETPSNSPKNKKTNVSGGEDTTGNRHEKNTVEYPETEKSDYSPGEQKMARK